jgi:fatty-acyl-CoA synthase
MRRADLDGSIGQEYRFSEIALKGIDGGPDPTEAGQLGEICMRGPGMMSGYFNRPEATAAAIRDGWLHTGDLAIRNDEGHYFFQDRLKEMIKSGGENVYSSEVEQFLHMHPAVVEAAVLGVPSDAWGEEVRAVVALRNGMNASDSELSAFLRTHIAGYKVPKQYVFVLPEELPRSGAGKLVKQKLKEQVGWA